MNKIGELDKKYATIEEFRAKFAPIAPIFFNCETAPQKGSKQYKKQLAFFYNSLINTSNLQKMEESEIAALSEPSLDKSQKNEADDEERDSSA